MKEQQISFLNDHLPSSFNELKVVWEDDMIGWNKTKRNHL